MRVVDVCILGAVMVTTSFGVRRLGAQDLTGCYRLRLGAWSGRLPAADSLETPPRLFALDSTPATTPLPFGMRVEPPNPAHTTPVGREPRWWRTGPDSVYVVWSNGFDGVKLDLVTDGHALRGIAQAFAGANGRQRPQARVLASRVVCPSTPPRWVYAR
jgi:hypothetical protein